MACSARALILAWILSLSSPDVVESRAWESMSIDLGVSFKCYARRSDNIYLPGRTRGAESKICFSQLGARATNVDGDYSTLSLM